MEDLMGRTVTFSSLMLAGAMMGVSVRVTGPAGYEPTAAIVEKAAAAGLRA